MFNFRGKIPSPKALLAFEAAARLGSFTEAANELNVTQVAVTYQIRKIENELGITLFEREHRGVRLTPMGERLQVAVTSAFQEIATAVLEIRKLEEDNSITISALNSISYFWLNPIMSEFRQRHPGVDLRLLADDSDNLNYGAGGIDLAIRYGEGDWSGFEVHHLFDEVRTVVCSPEYLRRHGPLQKPEDLFETTLLQQVALKPSWPGWRNWFSALGIDLDADMSLKIVEFSNFAFMLEAAANGEGVTFGGQRLTEKMVEEGRLVRLDFPLFRTGQAYYAALPEGRVRPKIVDDLLETVIRAARQE